MELFGPGLQQSLLLLEGVDGAELAILVLAHEAAIKERSHLLLVEGEPLLELVRLLDLWLHSVKEGHLSLDLCLLLGLLHHLILDLLFAASALRRDFHAVVRIAHHVYRKKRMWLASPSPGARPHYLLLT